MAQQHIRVEMLGLRYVQRLAFAAADLLREVEDGDEALIPDSVAEAAARLREAFGEALDDAPGGG